MKAIKMIRDYEKTREGNNTTRLYNVVNPIRNGEVRIDTYAVKTGTKAQGLVIKKVARYYTDRRRYWTRDVLVSYMGGYFINWCDQSWGRKHQAVWQDVDAYQGAWGYNDYSFSGNGQCFLRNAVYLNGFAGTRYEHCGYDVTKWNSLHFMQYAECWKISPSVEFLTKSGLDRFITPAFVRDLKADKEFFRFFRNNLAEIKKHWYGIGAIRYAKSSGASLADADAYVTLRTEIGKCKVPAAVPRFELAKYLKKNDVTPYQYGRYCDDLKDCEIDIDTFGYMFPTNWRKRFDEVHDAAHAIRMERWRKEQKAELARERREAKARLARWKVICGYVSEKKMVIGGYDVVFPKSVTDLKREGKLMHNCIGTYGRNWKAGNALLFFLYKDGKPVVDCEVNPNGFGLIQARYVNNEDATAADKEIANKIAAKIKHACEVRMAA